MTRSRSQRWISLWGLGLLLLTSACTNELLVDVEQRSVQQPDGGAEEDAALEEDAGDPVGEPDAASPKDGGNPALDAGKADAALDAGPPDSAVSEAGRPDAASPPDASEGGPPEAGPGDGGCTGPACPDAAFPTTVPCPGGCGVNATFLENRCPNGAPETCWTSPNGGACERQCPPVTGCTAAGGCASDEYCYFPHNDCGASSPGHCAKRPKSCPPLDIKVCGCNGTEYLNGCVATQQGGTDVAGPDHAMCK